MFPSFPRSFFLEKIVCRPFRCRADNFLHHAGEIKRSAIIRRTSVRQNRVGVASGQHLQEGNRTVYVAVVPLRQSPAKTIVRILTVSVFYS